MFSQSKAMRVRFVVTMCMVLAGGAVSMGTSCITAPKGKGGTGAGGTINGTVDSLGDGAAIGSGVTVTATDSATGSTFVGTTAANGTFSITGVPKGGGTLTVSTVPSGCTAPSIQAYSGETNGGTLTYNITVDCPIELP